MSIQHDNKDIDGNTLNAGDTAVCVDDTASFNRLRVGNVYRVEDGWAGPGVLSGGNYFISQRFRKVAALKEWDDRGRDAHI
jgi:hypothetical protein